MIVALSFVNGFQDAVSQKVFSFWGHIRVQHFELGKALVAEESPISRNDTVENELKRHPSITHVQVFATKSAVLEKDKEIEGVLCKGVDNHFDSTQIKPFIKRGRWLCFNDSLYNKEVIVSEQVANQLKLQLNDTARLYFISANEGTGTYRKLKVVGIYKTGIEEYDKLFVLTDIRLIRRINNWQPNEIGGYEVFLDDYKKMDTLSNTLDSNLPTVWTSKTVREVYPNIFDWLEALNVNRNVVIVVMSIVAIINLITCLLILVLERTKMIGVLKSIGASNGLIRKIFIYHATLISLKGVGLGCIIGVGICLLQQYTGIITFDEANYYVSTAPVHLIWWQVILICTASILVCFLSLLIPTLIVKRITPVKAIQFS